jgi:hypothetical protein
VLPRRSAPKILDAQNADCVSHSTFKEGIQVKQSTRDDKGGPCDWEGENFMLDRVLIIRVRTSLRDFTCVDYVQKHDLKSLPA